MILRRTTKYPNKDGSPRLFWGCSLWPRCNGTHGAHPDGRPLGKPADQATKAARIRAHAVFDKLWKEQRLSRVQAYRVMRSLLDLTRDEAHISRFNIRQCEQLIALLEEIDGYIIFPNAQSEGRSTKSYRSV